MAFIYLPALPRLAKVSPRIVRFGGDLTSALGGPTQRILRLGSRYSIQIELPRMDAVCASRWIAAGARADAEGKTLRLVLPQFGTSAAAPVVGVGGGASMSLSSGAGIAVGQWFSFVKDGRAYLHQVTSISGADIGVAPQLRVDPDGLTLTFDSPTIEGFADTVAWDMELLRYVGQTITITEDR